VNENDKQELWAAVNKTRNAQHDGGLAILHNPDTVKNYFAKIASKEHYDPRELDRFMCECDDDNFEPLTNFEAEQLLSKIKLTAAGCDGIPAWLLRSCSYELADIVAHILNCSFSTGRVPSYWLNALVTPVPKVSASIVFSDFRPISVTPHLNRIAEKVIVRRWLQPAIPADKILDQFALKPSGSTTTALVYFTHQLTKMLEQNAYVRCLIIDFAKAFDTVDHVILLHKLKSSESPRVCD